LEEHERDGKKTLTHLPQKYTVKMSEGLRDRIIDVSAYCLSCYTGGKGFTLRLTSTVQRT